MVATICLFTCALTVGQPADRSDWLLMPRLNPGQELVYSGHFTEERLGQGVGFQRSYRLQSNVFIQAVRRDGMEVAFLTMLELRPSIRLASDSTTKSRPCSVRLELARVDKKGRVAAPPGVALTPPLDGPPTAECGAFVELPLGRMGKDSSWEVAENHRPPLTWQIAGSEVLHSTLCVKLLGQQQSEDWDRPRSDRMAWRRRDTVWLSPKLGIAFKVERVIERREAAHKNPTQRSVVLYELESHLTYPGELGKQRQEEIRQAHYFFDQAAPLLRQPVQSAPQLDAILKKIANHLENQPETPYRKAILQVQRRVEAARRGELPPEPLPEDSLAPPRATLGQKGPDFVASNLITHQTCRLYRLMGRPILLVFYNPAAPSAAPVLHFAQKEVNDRYGEKVTVLALAVTENVDKARKQYTELGLTFSMLSGQGFYSMYGVDATPRMVVLDAEGIVRGAYTGWGSQTPREVSDELRRWLPR
jgi:peroxiredoxin